VGAARALPFALAGLLFGSFLTVVVHRMPRRESVVAPRSACPSCGAPVRARDNVPVLSWLLLRGRCRACRARISAEYPLVEAVTGALFVGAALAFREVGTAALVAPFLGVMLAAALIDARHRIIPNRLLYPSLLAFGAAVAVLGVAGEASPATAGLGLVACGGGLLVVHLVSPGGMGMGDVKLAALIGLVLGALGWSYVAVAVMVGVLAGGLAAVAMLAAGRRRKDTLPFGPFLALGAIVSAFLAPPIASWYLGLA
jgi:leader peptidase (prepilin peptidase)/N-methyltransferase